MVLKRYQNYAQLNPLPSWLIQVAVLLMLNVALFWGAIGPRNFIDLMMPLVLALSVPTGNILARLSEAQRQGAPVPLRQEEGIGLLSLSALGASIGALGVVTFSRHLGLFLPSNTSVPLLLTFSLSALLSLALGYAARRTPEGLRGLRLSSSWLALIVGAACVLLLLRHP